MLLRHLRYFAAVADHGSFARAARALRVAQPALSRQIHALELEVGSALFTRERRGVRLTNAGAALVDSAPRVFRAVDGAVSRARLACDGTFGRIRIGVGRCSVANPRVGSAIARLRDRFPDVELLVDEVAAVEQAAALRERRIDVGIGIIGEYADVAVETAELLDESIDCVMLATSHPLAARTAVVFDELRAEPLLKLRDREPHRWRRLWDALRPFAIAQSQELETVEEVFAAVAGGRGWTFAASSLRSSPPPGTVVVPIEGFRVAMSVVAQWRADDHRRLTSNVVASLRGQIPCPSTEASAWPASLPSTQLEFRHLETVIAAANAGSLSRAARATGLTHAGMTRRIAAVEKVVGCPVFRRTGASLELTGAGEVLVREAERALTLRTDAIAEARRRARGITGVCRIAALPGSLDDDLIRPLRDHGRSHPEVALEFHEMASPAQIPALDRNEIDIGLGGTNPSLGESPTIASICLMDNPLDTALLSAAHPLASRSRLSIADLASVSFLLIDRNEAPGFFDLVTLSLAEFGISPDSRSTASGLRALWRMVVDSGAWTIAPHAQRRHPPGGMVAIPIDGVSIPWGFNMRWRRNERSPAVLEVVEVMTTKRGHR